jgi:phosphate transport system substrate-binding protein
MGAKGNEGVAGQVKTTPGTIGYIELAYARADRPSLRVAARTPPARSSSRRSRASAPPPPASWPRLPDDMRKNIVNPSGEAAYPISAFTYILVYAEMPDGEKSKALVDFLWWALHDGQKLGRRPPLRGRCPPRWWPGARRL